MKKRLINIIIGVALVLAPLLFTACGSPAGPPAPPTEIPSPIVLKFVEPADLQIDLSTVSLATPSISKAVDPGGEFAMEIAGTSGAQDFLFNFFLIPTMQGIGKIEIPVGDTVTTFHEEIDFGPLPAGTDDSTAEILLTGVHDIKISFADVDFDGDGVLEGCSGHTASLPICVRMWRDDVHYIAWVFERYPYLDDPATAEVENSPGIGRLKLYAADVGYDAWPDTVAQRLDYDFETAGHTSSQWEFRMYDPVVSGSGFGWQLRLTQDGPAATAVKQVAYQSLIDIDGFANPAVFWDDRSDYLAQFREGYDFWSGSILSCASCKFDLDPMKDLTNQCARISTGEGTAESDCADVGGIDIRVGDIPFLEPFEAAYVALPADFPETPPPGMF